MMKNRPIPRSFRLFLAGILVLAWGPAAAQEDMTAKVNAGWQALQKGQLAEARAAFQSVLDASPTYEFGWYALGQVATREGKFDEAILDFQKASELDANQFRNHYGLAAVYRSKGSYDQAITTLNNAELLASDKQSKYLLHLERGLSYLSLHKYKEASADLEQAVAIQPGNKMAEQRYGMALYGLRQYQQAVDHLKKAAAQDAADYTTQLYLARGYIHLGQQQPDKEKKARLYAEAVHAGKVALGARQGFEAQNVLARAYLGARSFDGAIREFQGVIKSRPKYCAARANLGQAYIGKHSWPEAVQALEGASECDPRNTTTLNLLAYAYMKQEVLDKSLATYQKSYEMKQDPLVAEHIELVKKNMEIAGENAQIESFNEEQQALLAQEQEEFERKMKAFEEEQRRIQEYKESDN
ncbi:MAG: tetratricopeptide repeat protein [Acidobacteriota bacterium]